MLINVKAVKALVTELRPDMRSSREYLETLNAKVRGIVVAQVRANGSKKTLKADVFLGVPPNGNGGGR